jgi:hypothetical protein
MIGMVMGRQDMVRSPARAFRRGKDRAFLGRVDEHGLAATCIMDQHAEIVAATHELLDPDWHFELPLLPAGTIGRRAPFVIPQPAPASLLAVARAGH